MERVYIIKMQFIFTNYNCHEKTIKINSTSNNDDGVIHFVW
jgi:hypothetical protein